MLIAGIDEVGYGALVGELVVAAVILPLKHDIVGIKDSKKLTPKQRERLYNEITAKAIAWKIAKASPREIDKYNILNANMRAMQRAVEGLSVQPDKVFVDGNKLPHLSVPVEGVVQGDAKFEQIAAASIIAKVTRDRLMIALDEIHPEYGFASHKGYGTARHMQALKEHGPIDAHRRSYAPVASAMRIGIKV